MGRGLHNFIRDLKNAATPEKEQKRVFEELAKIRAKFRGEKDLDAYNKKKYVWKLLYIFMLGYEVDFGVIEAVHLVAMPGYAEKSCGYLAVSLLLEEGHEMMQLVINSVRSDLTKSHDTQAPENQCLALGLLSNLGAGPFMEELCPLVIALLSDKAIKISVRKKAALTLVSMNRKQGEASYVDPAELHGEVLGCLDTSSDIGLCTSMMSLLLSLIATSREGWHEAPRVVISLLGKLRLNERGFCKGYTYFQIPSPWLQIKCMRVLQHFEPVAEGGLPRKQVFAELSDIITKTDVAKKNQNKINALHAIFFEAVNLCNHYCSFDGPGGGGGGGGSGSPGEPREDFQKLLLQAVEHLGKFLIDDRAASENKNLKLCNVRYLALDTMSRLAVIPGGAALLKKYTESFIIALSDLDMGIRSRSLDVLYEMADRATVAKIVDKFLDFLADAENEVKEQLVLKVAILAERWATKFDWYVDVILRLIEVAGDAVSDDIWHRVVFIVTNNEPHNPGLHKYAAAKVFEAVSREVAHENTVKVAAYLLGEFGYHIAAESPDSSFERQFEALHAKFGLVSPATKAIVLNAFIKLQNSEPLLAPRVRQVLSSCVKHFDQELQQRACEYIMFAATQQSNPELMPVVFEAMDFFPDRDNPLVQRLLSTDAHGGQEAGHILQRKREKASMDPSSFASRESESGSGGGAADTEQAPPAIEPEPEPAGDSVGDLLGMLSAPAPAPPPPVGLVQGQPQQGVVTSPPVTDLTDLAGLGGGGATSAQIEPPSVKDLTNAQMGEQGMKVSVMPSVAAGGVAGQGGAGGLEARVSVGAEVVGAFATRSKGRLYKDAQIEVGALVVVDVSSKVATLTLFCGNTSGPASPAGVVLDGLSISVGATAELQVQVEQPAPRVLEPRQQKKHVLRVQCVGPFAAPPPVTVAFTAAGQARTVEFPLPLPLVKFIEGVALAPAAFMATWGKVTAGPPCELQQVVDLSSAGGIDIGAVQDKLTAIGLSAVTGLDPKPENRVFAAKFGNVPIMLRLESHMASGKIRFTIRTTNAAVSSTIMETAAAQF